MHGIFRMGRLQPTVVSSAGAARAESKTHALARKMRVLESSVEKALMINEVLWEIIRDKHGLSDTDLHKKIHEVDMRDGVIDGKNQRKPTECSDCGRMVSARHPACIYCGTVIDTSVFTME